MWKVNKWQAYLPLMALCDSVSVKHLSFEKDQCYLTLLGLVFGAIFIVLPVSHYSFLMCRRLFTCCDCLPSRGLVCCLCLVCSKSISCLCARSAHTGDLRPGSHLFLAVFKMNFGESELHIRRSHAFELYCILLLNMFCICTQLYISKYLLKRKI